MENHKRQFYRINYPVDARPRLRINKKSYDIIDISEEGIKFRYDEVLEERHLGAKIRGTITFKGGQALDLKGTVTRLFKEDMIIKPKESISYEDIIIKEQLYILKNYPLLKFSQE